MARTRGTLGEALRSVASPPVMSRSPAPQAVRASRAAAPTASTRRLRQVIGREYVRPLAPKTRTDRTHRSVARVAGEDGGVRLDPAPRGCRAAELVGDRDARIVVVVPARVRPVADAAAGVALHRQLDPG